MSSNLMCEYFQACVRGHLVGETLCWKGNISWVWWCRVEKSVLGRSFSKSTHIFSPTLFCPVWLDGNGMQPLQSFLVDCENLQGTCFSILSCLHSIPYCQSQETFVCVFFFNLFDGRLGIHTLIIGLVGGCWSLFLLNQFPFGFGRVQNVVPTMTFQCFLCRTLSLSFISSYDRICFGVLLKTNLWMKIYESFIFWFLNCCWKKWVKIYCF